MPEVLGLCIMDTVSLLFLFLMMMLSMVAVVQGAKYVCVLCLALCEKVEVGGVTLWFSLRVLGGALTIYFLYYFVGCGGVGDDRYGSFPFFTGSNV
jgi:hypothetical protein